MLLAFALAIILGTIAGSKAKGKRNDKKYTIVVDAGHGGGDPGKVSVDGSLEKTLNLEISIKLKHKLEEKGYKVFITRDEDISLADDNARNKKTSDMKNRMDFINSCNADYMISIHQNSYTDASVKGAQVFYYSKSEKGRELAEHIQKNIKQKVDKENKRNIKAGDDYYILKKSICPAVIVECGFLSCMEETKKLKDSNYQDKLVDAIVSAIEDL